MRTSSQKSDVPRPRRPLTVELLGRQITLVSDAPETRVQEIVEAVNARMTATRGSLARASAEQVAILTALNIAEELIDAERRLRALKDGVRSRSRWLLEAIDDLAVEAHDAPATQDVITGRPRHTS
ncbi:MAG: cell division protein ZapA [Deltaproteobacteria bacterium]|nr:cell division protein ZapA [Deltaproteobacteria bacterium]